MANRAQGKRHDGAQLSDHLEVSSPEDMREKVLGLLRKLAGNMSLCASVVKGLVLFRSQGLCVVVDRAQHRAKRDRPLKPLERDGVDDFLDHLGPNLLRRASWCVITAAAAHAAAYVASLEEPPPMAEHSTMFWWHWCRHHLGEHQGLIEKVQELRLGEWTSNMGDFEASEVDAWLSDYFCQNVQYRKNRLWSGAEQVPCHVQCTQGVRDHVP